MASSAEDRFVGGGAARHDGGGGEEQRLLTLHHPQLCYHVPQHSRREKLRFLTEESPPPLYPAGNSLTAAAYLPSSSFQFDAHGEVVPPPHAQHQIPGGGQGFSLSLAAPRLPAPRPLLATRPPAPLGPFTGYAAVLSRSRFLEPARKLLEEVCGRAAPGQQQAAAGRGGSGTDKAREMLLEADPARESPPADHGMEQQWRKTRLISMLDEVYRRYKQYYQQVQAVITSFESVAGLSNAAPFASMALKVMSKHFRFLKNTISGQLRQTTTKGLGNSSLRQESISSFGLLNGSGYHQIRTANNTGSFAQPHAWRPQRGLPERAVSVLRAWLFDHFLHPYPTDADKQNLAKQTGLTRNQVSNWFINARVRLWKPMVEEVHSLEMRKKNKTSAAAGDENSNSDDQLLRPPPPPSSSSKTTNPFDCHQQFQIARAHNGQYSAAPRGVQGHVNFAHGDRSTHENAGGTGRGNGVSLTLGLHQNDAAGVCFTEPLDPINVARRFGLEECNATYLVSAFGGQERPFGKDESSRLLRDFVG